MVTYEVKSIVRQHSGDSVQVTVKYTDSVDGFVITENFLIPLNADYSVTVANIKQTMKQRAQVMLGTNNQVTRLVKNVVGFIDSVGA